MIIAVIPAFNEKKNIFDVVHKSKKYVNRVIVVDDSSKDKTASLARRAGAVVLTHKINLGLGASLKTGCDAAIILGADTIITIDADGQHNPNEIPKFIKKIKTGKKVVFGYRTINKKEMPFQKIIGNLLISKLGNFLFGINLSDIETGYRCFTKDAYKKIRWESSGYNVANEIAINTKKQNLSYCEIPIDTIYKDKYKGVNIREGILILADLIKKRF